MSIHFFNAFKIGVILFALSQQIAVLVPQLLHFLFIQFFIRYFPVDNLWNVVAYLFKLSLFLLGECFLLDGHCVQLLLLSLYFLLQWLYCFLFIEKKFELWLQRENLLLQEVDFVLFRLNLLTHLPCAVWKHLLFLLQLRDLVFETAQLFLPSLQVLLLFFKLTFFHANRLVHCVQFVLQLLWHLPHVLVVRHELDNLVIQQTAVSFQRFNRIGVFCWFFCFLVFYFCNALTYFLELILMLLLNLINFLTERLLTHHKIVQLIDMHFFCFLKTLSKLFFQ